MLKLFQPVRPQDLSPEAMRKPLSAFSALDDSFAVVYVGGHQVRFFLSV
jgi:hypothetical protein